MQRELLGAAARADAGRARAGGRADEPAAAAALDAARGIKREVERTQLRARKGIRLVARRPPPRISMTPKDEVWSLGKAKLWRYRNAGRDARAAGPAVPRPRRRLGDLRPPPRQLVGREAACRRLRRLPLRLGTSRGRGGRPHARDVPRRLLHPCRRRRRAASRGPTEISVGRLLHGCADGSCSLLGSRDDVPGSQRRPVHAAVRLRPRAAVHGATTARDGCCPRTPSTRRRGSCPESAIRAMFRLLQPTSDLVQYVTLWEHLWRDDYVRGPPSGQPLGVEPPRHGGTGLPRAGHRYVQGNRLVDRRGATSAAAPCGSERSRCRP